MTGSKDDRAHLIAHRRLMEEIEMAMRAANQEIIGRKLPHLNRDSFFKLAVSIARVRAQYLEAVMAMDWEHCTPEQLETIENRRAVYEAARTGFEALQHAFERGYVTLEAMEGKS
ncbi:hypothetical protein F1188_02245 [Roseospira marina]|uniref:Uncharacterized protein n=1 Tax=Roseospira marina TaxID=140057 RepID=A0A5M6IH21_9PROT|nr:hypothetical protein [Roseospira marina]KAA5607600.1 hypothetical protein F1188_02245 [Roseospira marina]MBB4312205.1 hypothetical protein [Roseospira marina]MBB5085779.1 hypothetical protein [Roseospira marina]